MSDDNDTLEVTIKLTPLEVETCRLLGELAKLEIPALVKSFYLIGMRLKMSEVIELARQYKEAEEKQKQHAGS